MFNLCVKNYFQVLLENESIVKLIMVFLLNVISLTLISCENHFQLK